MLLENPLGDAPLTLLGLTGSGFPVYALAGAEPDDEIEIEPDDEAPESEGAEGEEAESGDDEEKTKLRASLKKANAEAAKYRRQLREAQKNATETAVEEAEAEAEEKGTELTPAQLKRAVDKARKEAGEAAETKYRKVAIHAAAESAFVKAGAKASGVEKLVRLIDLDDVDIDSGTGRITAGLDEQIDVLKDEFPELFAPQQEAPKTKPKPKRAAAAPRPEAAEQPLSSAEKIAAQLGVNTR